MIGNLSLLELDVSRPSPGGALLRDIQKAADLTAQLLAFAKTGDALRRAINLAELVRENAHFILPGQAARAEFEAPDDLWPAAADRAQLGQVVQNLVLNAAQAMPSGGNIRITLANAS